jgi:glucose-1-phosphate adenylyltransferase
LNEFLGIINLSETEENIRDLTVNRSIAAIPFGGRYRVIDFALSNMVNADIETVGMFTNNKYRSLQDHVGSGKPWELDRKTNGMFFITPICDYHSMNRRPGDLGNFKNSLDFITKAKSEYVLITKGYMICNINYKLAFEKHIKSGADMTIIYKKVKNDEQWYSCDTLNLDGDGKVLNIGENLSNQDEINISMEMYMMKKETLINVIKTGVEEGQCNYLKQALFNKFPEMNVMSYEYEGYLACINSVKNYYKTSMDLLDREKFKELFYGNSIIYTKVKDEPSSFYLNSSLVKNSVVANGCIIEGTVENSILFRDVHIKKGVVVKNSVILQGTKINEDVKLDCVILDKNTVVKKGQTLIGIKENPFVIRKLTSVKTR